MFRRLPILPLVFAATLGLFALTSVVTAQPPGTTPVVKPGDIGGPQAENAKLYKRFADELLRLAQKWEKSENPDERERAKNLRAALELAARHGVENLFKDLQAGLANKNPNGTVYGDLLTKDTKLRAALEEILRTLETEDDLDATKRKIAEIKDLIDKIGKIKAGLENVRARTDNPKSDPNNLAKDQKNLAKQTDDVAKSFPGQEKKGGDAAGGAPKDDKSEPKPETKPGAASPENKPDTKEDKSNTKAGDGAGMPMGGGEPKPSPMGGKPSDGDKPSPKDGMGAGDPKPGEPKPMGGMPMDPKPNTGDSKAQGDGKGDPKPSAGMPGGDSKPMSGMPMGGMPPMGGSPSQSKPSPGGGMPSPGGMPPPGGSPQGPKDQAQEDVQKAVPPQQEAEQDIRGGDNDKASKNQDKAIEQLERALKELEKRLKQLREKELEKLLANLEERVGRMLRMQIEVKAATEIIDKAVQKNPGPGGKAQTAEIQKSQAEADKELAIISEADKTLKLMEGEGSAVVFAGVLTQVRGDMVAVQKRLNEGRVEKRTQDIEQDIIDQLTMMKEALKKAKEALKDPPKPGDPKDPNGKQPDKKLIDLINELKLIKSLQEQVNKRTLGYSKDDPGEQAKDPLVQAELQQLAERQRVLQEMLHKIATQANQ
jgi:tetratricopeptide (TPR) repeat protein